MGLVSRVLRLSGRGCFQLRSIMMNKSGRQEADSGQRTLLWGGGPKPVPWGSRPVGFPDTGPVDQARRPPGSAGRRGSSRPGMESPARPAHRRASLRLGRRALVPAALRCMSAVRPSWRPPASRVPRPARSTASYRRAAPQPTGSSAGGPCGPPALIEDSPACIINQYVPPPCIINQYVPSPPPWAPNRSDAARGRHRFERRARGTPALHPGHRRAGAGDPSRAGAGDGEAALTPGVGPNKEWVTRISFPPSRVPPVSRRHETGAINLKRRACVRSKPPPPRFPHPFPFLRLGRPIMQGLFDSARRRPSRPHGAGPGTTPGREPAAEPAQVGLVHDGRRRHRAAARGGPPGPRSGRARASGDFRWGGR